MTGFLDIYNDLRNTILYNKETFLKLISKNPHIVYEKLNELALFVGRKYNISINLNFPNSRAIMDIDRYGTENLGLVFDKFKKRFPISRIEIKDKAESIISQSNATDAYMYEGKEGVRITWPDGRIEIMPGSLHLWCKIDDKVIEFCNWLLEIVYSSNITSQLRDDNKFKF